MRAIKEFGRQLLLPGGVILLCAAAMHRFDLVAPLSIDVTQTLIISLGIACLVLAWKFHLPRVSLAVSLLMALALGIGVAGHVSDVGMRAMLVLLSVAVPVNMAFLLLIDDSIFDPETIGWWAGVVFVQALIILGIAKTESTGIVNWLVRPMGTWAGSRPAIILCTCSLIAILVNAVITRKATDCSLFWSGLCVILAFSRMAAGGEGIYFTCSLLLLGSGIIETSYTAAYYDELTGLPGRRALSRHTSRLPEHFCVAMVDIDHFKKFNDSYGHDIGDQVLRMVSTRLSRVTGGGRAFRCGGEEFAIIFTGLPLGDVYEHLELLREDIELTPFVVRGPDRSTRKRDEDRRVGPKSKKFRNEPLDTHVTVSIGVATPQSGQDVHEVMRWADRALYQAKGNGRNQVVCFSPMGDSSRRSSKNTENATASNEYGQFR